MQRESGQIYEQWKKDIKKQADDYGFFTFTEDFVFKNQYCPYYKQNPESDYFNWNGDTGE